MRPYPAENVVAMLVVMACSRRKLTYEHRMRERKVWAVEGNNQIKSLKVT